MRALHAVLAAACIAGAALPQGLAADPVQLSIDKALSLAREGSEAVRIKELGAAKAGDRLAQVRARAFPSISLEASGSWLANPPEGITVKAGELGTIPLPVPPFSMPLPSTDIVFVPDAEHTYFKADLSLSQPLFTWGKIAAAIAISEREVAAAGAELAGQRRDTARQAHAAYFGALLAERSLDLLAGMRTAAQAVLEDRQRAFEEGASIRQDVLQAEAALASVESKLVEAEESSATALEGLSMLTGVPAADIRLASGFREALPALDEQALKAAAAGSTPELLALRERAGVAREKLALEKGGAVLLPDFSLAVALGVTGQKVPWASTDWSDSWNWDLRISLGTRANLFDAGSSRAKGREAGRDVEAAGLAIAQVEKLTAVKVRTGVQEARKKAALLAEARAKASAAGEQARNARVSFENELATREEMNSAAIALLSTRLAALGAAWELEDALAEIEYLSGQDLGGR
jgi:outer membrane protein